MLASSHGRRSARPWAVWGALPALPALPACSDTGPSTAAWGFVALAFVLVAALAFVVGWMAARQRGASALREARALAREGTALIDAWRWQTDSSSRLMTWQGPGLPPDDQCALFDDATLASRLRAQQPFSALRVRTAQTLEGSRAWLLRGTPRLDEEGRFAGFSGVAMPLDELETAQSGAAAVVPLLQSQGGAALLALHAGAVWRIEHLNEAAQALWPDALPGQALGVLPLPPPVLAALNGSAPTQAEGWHIVPFGPLPGGGHGLVLSQATHAADGDTPALTVESDNFSFTVSHDLRAPIRVVEGFTRIVKEDYGRLLDRVGNDHLDRVLGAAARMNLMIDALPTLARLSSQPLARQPVNLSQLAGYVVDDLKRGTPEREADVEIEAGLTTQGDPTLLRLVLENLIGNAWKYSARSPRAHISLAATSHGGRLAYVVRDNGAGFDMRSAERLFGLFQRLHSASEFPGHGVGLASVRRIVRRHGGEIWAEAEPGRGAAFYFTLAG